MASLWLSVLLCLTTLLFSLSCITAGAEETAPPSPTSADAGLVPRHRSRREPEPLPESTADKVEKSWGVVTASLTVFKEVLEKRDPSHLTGIVRSLSSIASLAPGIGSLVASIVNVFVLAYTDSPLESMKSEFEDVHRHLDSISQQIAELKTHVEWNNYASIYSQDEIKILNSWNQFHKLLNKGRSTMDSQQRLALASKFVSFYENTGTEGSVASLYFYLTVRETSLSRNLINLVSDKYKCDINDVGRYNFYFSILLWKGMMLNQFYSKLIGHVSDGMMAAEHTNQFGEVLNAQKAALIRCADSNAFIEPAVRNIIQSLNLRVETRVQTAKQIKEELDKMYSSYIWIVVIFEKQYQHIIQHSTLINFGMYTVAVLRTNYRQQKDSYLPLWLPESKITSETCFDNTFCSNILHNVTVKTCVVQDSLGTRYLRDYFADFLVFTRNNVFVAYPPPFISGTCVEQNSPFTNYPFYFYAKLAMERDSPWHPCRFRPCLNGGNCLWVPGTKSTLIICECQNGFSGDRCERRIRVSAEDMEVELPQPIAIPNIVTVYNKLTQLTTLNNHLITIDNRLTQLDAKISEMNASINRKLTKIKWKL